MDLAAVSRINETQISKIESGEYGPHLQTIRALALALGKYPSELFDFEFDFKLNTDFNVVNNKGKRPGTTDHINKLLKENFFKAPRTVADVITQAKKTYGVNLASADTSGALLRLVKKKLLKRTQESINGKSQYQKA